MLNVGWQMTSSPPRIFLWRKNLLLPCSESLWTWQPINFHPPSDFIKEVNVLVPGHFVTKPQHPQLQRKGLGHYQRKENWEQRMKHFFPALPNIRISFPAFCCWIWSAPIFTVWAHVRPWRLAWAGRACIYEFWATTVAQFLSFISPPQLPWVITKKFRMNFRKI